MFPGTMPTDSHSFPDRNMGSRTFLIWLSPTTSSSWHTRHWIFNLAIFPPKNTKTAWVQHPRKDLISHAVRLPRVRRYLISHISLYIIAHLFVFVKSFIPSAQHNALGRTTRYCWMPASPYRSMGWMYRLAPWPFAALSPVFCGPPLLSTHTNGLSLLKI